jgi:hypothetical protein
MMVQAVSDAPCFIDPATRHEDCYEASSCRIVAHANLHRRAVRRAALHYSCRSVHFAGHDITICLHVLHSP